MAGGQSVEDIIVRLNADTAKFQTETKKAQESLNYFAEKAAEASKRIEHLFEIKFAIEGAEKLWEWVKSSAEAAHAMGRLAESAGVPIDEFSKLAFAAKITGTDAESLSGGLQKLARNMAKAGVGAGDAARGFAAIGVSVKDGDGNLRSAQDVMLDVADSFEHMENGAGKTALAMMLFGKSGASLIPFLNKGRDGIEEFGDTAARLGKVMSEETARGAESFTESLKTIDAAMSKSGAKIAAELAPALEEFVATFTASGGEIQSVWGDVFDGLVFGFRSVAGMALSLGTGIADLTARFVFLGQIAKAAWNDGLQSPAALKAVADLEHRLTSSDTRYERGMASLGFNAEGGYQPPKQGVSFLDPDYQAALDGRFIGHHEEVKHKAPVIADPENMKAEDDALKSLTKTYQQLEQKVQTFGQGDAAEMEWRLQFGDLADMIEKAGAAGGAMRPKILAAAGALESLKDADKNWKEEFKAEVEEVSKALESADKGWWSEFNAQVAESARVLEATRTPTEEYAAELERLGALYQATAIDADTYARAVEHAQMKLPAGYEGTISPAVSSAVGGFAQMAQGAKSFGDVVQDVWQSIVSTASNAMSQMLSRWIAMKMAMSFGGAAAGIDAAWGVPLTALAGGGSVYRGETYLVGEEGPELFKASASGQIIPHGQTKALFDSAGTSAVASALHGSPPSGMSVTLINQADGVRHESRQISATEVEIIAREVVERHAPSVVARDLHGGPNSRTQAALRKTTTIESRR